MTERKGKVIIVAWILAIAALGILLLFAAHAKAQTVCLPYDAFTKIVSERNQEQQRGYGVVNENNVVTLWASKDGSFSIVTVSPKTRMACFVAAGQGWEIIENKDGDT